MASKFAEQNELTVMIATDYSSQVSDLAIQFIENNAKTDEDAFYLMQAFTMGGVSQLIQMFYQSMIFAGNTDSEIVPQLIDHLRKVTDAARDNIGKDAPQIILPEKNFKA